MKAPREFDGQFKILAINPLEFLERSHTHAHTNS